MSEGLLDDHSSPAPRAVEAGRAQGLGNGNVETRGRGEIDESVAGSPSLSINLLELSPQTFQALEVAQIGGNIKDAGTEALPHAGVHRIREKLTNGFPHQSPKFLMVQTGATGSQNGETSRQEILLGQTVERRDQLTTGEIP